MRIASAKKLIVTWFGLTGPFSNVQIRVEIATFLIIEFDYLNQR